MRYAIINCLVISGAMVWLIEGAFIVDQGGEYSKYLYSALQFIVFGFISFGSQIARYLIHKISIKKLMDAGILVSMFGTAVALVFGYFDFLIPTIIAIGISCTGGTMISGSLNRLAIESSDVSTGIKTATLSCMTCLSGAVLGPILNEFSTGKIESICIIIAAIRVLCTITYLTIRNQKK